MNWRCAEGHEWEAIPGNIGQGQWCPHCANERKRNRVKWTDEEILKHASRYKGLKEFREKDPKAYGAAERHCLMPELNGMLKRAKQANGYWTLERTREAASKCTTHKQFQEEYSSAFGAAKRNGW